MSAGQVLLVATLALPATGALVVALLPRRVELGARVIGTVAAGLAFVASLGLLPGPGMFGWFAVGPEPLVQPWHQVQVDWVPWLNLQFHLGVDGISYPLVVLTTLLTLLCCLYTLRHVPHPAGATGSAPAPSPAGGDGTAGRTAGGEWTAGRTAGGEWTAGRTAGGEWTAGGTAGGDGTAEGTAAGGRGGTLIALLLVVETGIVGTFLALDLVLFFIFFEVVLLPMYAVIAGWGGERRRHAARKFALYTLFGSVLLLVGVFVVVAGAGTADIVALTGGDQLARGTQLLAFTLLALAFAVKAPLWPLHTWLPDAHTEAPTVGSVILAGVLLKMGTYGLIRIGVGVTPEGAAWAAPVLGVLAVAAIIVGALVCLAQTELKRLIAYSSVGHMGFVLLGIATLSTVGLQAALIGNIAHGVITGLLFFLAGAVKERAHTGELARLGGLRETSPALAGLLGFGAIASLGLPGLAGFWGEMFAVVGAVQRADPLWVTIGVLAAAGAALTAAYFLRLLRRVTHGPAVPAAPAALTRPELLAWSPLVALALVIGLLPVVVLGMAYDPVGALAGVVTR
jgi:NADH-quinone oxidoreductase subunit M